MNESLALLAGVQAGLDALGAVEVKRVLRRVPVLHHRSVGELESRGVAAERGCSSTARLLTQVLRVHPGDAKARVAAAAALGRRRSLTGGAAGAGVHRDRRRAAVPQAQLAVVVGD